MVSKVLAGAGTQMLEGKLVTCGTQDLQLQLVEPVVVHVAVGTEPQAVPRVPEDRVVGLVVFAEPERPFEVLAFDYVVWVPWPIPTAPLGGTDPLRPGLLGEFNLL